MSSQELKRVAGLKSSSTVPMPAIWLSNAIAATSRGSTPLCCQQSFTVIRRGAIEIVVLLLHHTRFRVVDRHLQRRIGNQLTPPCCIAPISCCSFPGQYPAGISGSIQFPVIPSKLEIEVIRIREHTLVLIQGIDRSHVLSRQLEIKNLQHSLGCETG